MTRATRKKTFDIRKEKLAEQRKKENSKKEVHVEEKWKMKKKPKASFRTGPLSVESVSPSSLSSLF